MKKVSILCCLVFLSACATPYQEVGATGGFSETQLSENVWRVEFQGNGFTRKERAEDFALLRCAELTLQNGFEYFTLANSSTSVEKRTYTTPTTTYSTANAYGYGNSAYGYGTSQTYGGQTYMIAKPSTDNTVVMYKEKPNVQGMVLDAKFICHSIGQKYKVTCKTNK